MTFTKEIEGKEKAHKFKPAFSRKQLSIPYAIFLVLFVVLPLFIVVYYAFTDASGVFTLHNFISFF